MTQALVTGGAGFIGSHLVERLLGQGYAVRVVDDFSTGCRENLDAAVKMAAAGETSATLRAGGGRLHIIEGSATDEELMAFAAQGAEEVYHLAAAVGVQLIVAQPIQTLETNIRGTEVALAAAARAGAKFFLASSSEVYGKSQRIPFDEDDDLMIGSSRFVRWGYACSKAVDEFLAMAYARERGLPLVIGRFFNTIGPRQVGTYGMVAPRFVAAALEGRPVTVFGDGRQTRSFIDVRDTVEAAHRLMATASAAGEIYNIGGDQEIAISDLADKVITLAGSCGGKRLLTYQEAYGEAIDDMIRRQPSIRRARAALGDDWPRYSLDDSLRTIMASLRK